MSRTEVKNTTTDHFDSWNFSSKTEKFFFYLVSGKLCEDFNRGNIQQELFPADKLEFNGVF